MIGNEPESANRWATEHYGFVDDPASVEAADVTTPAAAGATPSAHGGPRSRRRTGLIASAVLSLALVAGIAGAAVASDAGPDGGRQATTQLDGGAGRGDLGPQGDRGDHR
jgi:hypothetical protein